MARSRSSPFLLLGLLLFHIGVLSAQPFLVEKVAVGAIFDQNTEEIQNLFKMAMTQHNQNGTNRARLELQAYVDVINTADAFKLSRLICNQFARGVWSMLGAVTPDSFDTLHSYTNTFQMPFITPWFPEKVIPPSSGLIDHAVSMRPDYHKAVVDTIQHYGWTEIIYIYDSHDGLLRLQQLYQLMQPGHTPFKISIVKRINNSSEAMEFLLALEQYDRWGNKRIVLDCSAKTAKSILVGHVRHVHLGRRTYHYILSGLVMDDHWENEVVEYGALNITGFRIIDQSRKIVRDFMEGLRKMDTRVKEPISAQAALMYDGVLVLSDALGRLFKKKPEFFRSALRRVASNQSNTTKVIDCNPGKSWVVPFEHGDKISRMIKKTDIEGLTGNISFNEDGRRHNFTLHVMEMTVQSAMVKIATWSDKYGLLLTNPKYMPLAGAYEPNKTYIVTTMLHEPYMMQKTTEHGHSKNDNYYGFCKDLFETIAREIGIKYEIRVVTDSKFENGNSAGGSNALVDELVRKEADFAVAPLAITNEREKLVDFTEPFISINYAIRHKRSSQQLTDTFSFLKPLSKEIWLCVVFSFFAVSIVLFLVSRFSPHEWKSISISDTHLDHPVSSTNEIILHNEFSIWNSFWFSLGSFMQQGSDVVPRSLSGRIVGTVWWFFALILVCSYTANLAAYLIVERIAEPSQTLNVQWNTPASSDSSSVLCDQIKEDPVFIGDDLKNIQYGLDEDGKMACNKFNNDCQLKQVDFAIATVKKSTFRERMNLALINMKRNGVLAKLLRKWLLKNDQQNCLLKKDEKNSISEMTLGQVAGIFYVLVGGLTVALCVAFLEFCQHGRAESTRANVSLRSALKAKARMTSSNERKLPHTPQRDRDRLGWNGVPFSGYYAAAAAGNQISQEEALQASFTHV